MSKRKQSNTKKSSPSGETTNNNLQNKTSLKWIIGGIAFLLIMVVVLVKMLPASDQNTATIISDSTTTQDTVSKKNNSTSVNTPPPISDDNDLMKKIPGNWYVTDRKIAGKSTAASGKLSKGSWQFYDDGSLKFTTTQYSDLGTWKIEKGKFIVSLYALGNYPGYISGIDAKTMEWVTTENIDGQQVSVTNHLSRSK